MTNGLSKWERLKPPLVYAITDRHQVAEAAYFDRIRRLLAAGIDILQIREKDLLGASLYHIAERVVRLAEPYPTRIFINERFDVALACGADGVHLPSRAIPAGRVRRVTGRRLIIGVSTHSPGAIRRAARQGADYVLFGPIFATPSKKNFGPPAGLARLSRVCRRPPVPVLALGGITMARMESVLDAGAYGIAAISLFLRSKNLPHDVRRIKAYNKACKRSAISDQRSAQ